MAEQVALACEAQHGRVLQAGDAAVLQESAARQKVSVAVHEVQRCALCSGLELGAHLALKTARVVDGIVAHPHFKNVAQQKDGVGRRGLQIPLPGGHGGGLAGLQVQVGNEIDRAPV